jgi:hypothetical protein
MAELFPKMAELFLCPSWKAILGLGITAGGGGRGGLFLESFFYCLIRGEMSHIFIFAKIENVAVQIENF